MAETLRASLPERSLDDLSAATTVIGVSFCVHQEVRWREWGDVHIELIFAMVTGSTYGSPLDPVG